MSKKQSNRSQGYGLTGKIRSSTVEDKVPKKQSSQVNPLFETQIKRPLSKNEFSDIELPAPFSTKDLGMSLTRKTSKILRESKCVVIEDGTKVPPMH